MTFSEFSFQLSVFLGDYGDVLLVLGDLCFDWGLELLDGGLGLGDVALLLGVFLGQLGDVLLGFV